jgi:serine phosphatase RsbU (regulator of sigma subunit)
MRPDSPHKSSASWTNLINARHRWAQATVVVVLIVAISLLRVIETQTGPLYLIPVVLAALWLGRWQGLAVGLVTAALTRVTIIISGDDLPDPTLYGEAIRFAVYGGLGYVVGALSENRLALERELGRRELELSELRTIQEALAPAELRQPGNLEVAASYVPAEHGVSGDFYVVAAAGNGGTLVAIGDVAGRGLDAAKQAWYVRTLIASSADSSDDPATVLERANRALIDESPYGAPFVTAACVICNPDGTVKLALAGHDQPIRLDDGRPLAEVPSGLPLGVFERVRSRTSSAQLAPGGGLLLYTDGLSEARRAHNGAPRSVELFGEDRIRERIEGMNGASSQGVVDDLQGAVNRFSGGELADDLCLLAVRYRGESAPAPGAEPRK